jgi:hypothetical protein
MKAIIISDMQGEIISITKIADVGAQPSGIIEAGVSEKKDQHVNFISLPPEVSKESLLKIHANYLIEMKKGRAVLVKNKYPTNFNKTK